MHWRQIDWEKGKEIDHREKRKREVEDWYGKATPFFPPVVTYNLAVAYSQEKRPRQHQASRRNKLIDSVIEKERKTK